MAEETLTYRLDQFEGPLDLLLTLIEKNKMDIADISISSIFDQYMEYLKAAKRMDLGIACEFIVMASTLMLIKSKMLLPRDPDKDDDPRKELANALLIYQKAKKDAEELRPLYAEFSGRLSKDNDEIPPEKGFPLGLDPLLLSKALKDMLIRLKQEDISAPVTLINPLIKRRVVSVEEKIDMILDKLEKQETASFFFLMKDAEDRAELLAIFMGILELVKIRRICICVGDEEEIDITTKFMLNPDYNAEEMPPIDLAADGFDDGEAITEDRTDARKDGADA